MVSASTRLRSAANASLVRCSCDSPTSVTTRAVATATTATVAVTSGKSGQRPPPNRRHAAEGATLGAGDEGRPLGAGDEGRPLGLRGTADEDGRQELGLEARKELGDALQRLGAPTVGADR